MNDALSHPPNFLVFLFELFVAQGILVRKYRNAVWLNAMHSGRKWWIREFVPPYIFPLNPDYVAARSLRSLRINKGWKSSNLWNFLGYWWYKCLFTKLRDREIVPSHEKNWTRSPNVWLQRQPEQKKPSSWRRRGTRHKCTWCARLIRRFYSSKLGAAISMACVVIYVTKMMRLF